MIAKRLLVQGLILTFMAIFFSPPAWAQKTGEPRLLLKQTVFDFKEVTEGSTISHTFSVINNGNETLKILRVKPGCGCSAAAFDQAIPPGGEGKIRLQVRTGGFRGEKAWEAKVYTDDPNSKEFTLAVKAFVKPALTLSSGKVSFYLNKNEVITKTVEIKGELPNPLTLVPSQFNLEGRVTYRIDELEKGKRFRLVFQNVPGQSGTFRGFLRLKTNYPEKPDVLIWIWVQHVDTSQKPPS